MQNVPKLIKGGFHQDNRGSIQFMNDFDMSAVKRFYCITNASTEIKRGWRGHRIEQRWFFASQGMFTIKLVKIENWENPAKNSQIIEFTLIQQETEVLHVPAGYASLIQSNSANASLLVFADYPLTHAKLDDYVYDTDYFIKL